MPHHTRHTADGSPLSVLEGFILARLALNGLPRVEELSHTYGRFQEHLDDLERDLRSAAGDVDRILCPPRKRPTPKRCVCR